MSEKDDKPNLLKRILCIYSFPGISTAETCILVRLAIFAGVKDWSFPSQKKLAAEVKMSERWVSELLGELESKNLLEIESRGRGNKYRIKWATLELATTGEVTSSITGKKRCSQFSCNGEVTSSENSGKVNSVVAVTKDHKCKRSKKASGRRSAFTFEIEIKAEEFRDPYCGLIRFGECVSQDWLKDDGRDRLAFMTIWFYIARRMDQKGKKRPHNPGGLLTDLLRGDDWRAEGSNADEDAARAFLKDQTRSKTSSSPIEHFSDQFALEDEGGLDER